MREGEPHPKRPTLRTSINFILLSSLLFASALTKRTNSEQSQAPKPIPTLEPTPYHPTITPTTLVLNGIPVNCARYFPADSCVKP